MTGIDREGLQDWYRQSMRARARELEGFREPLAGEDGAAAVAARGLGQKLRGSGASFGFPSVTEAATLLENAPAGDVLRRTEGLAELLRTIAWPDDPAERDRPAWLEAVVDADLAEAWTEGGLEGAWQAAAEALGEDDRGVAARVAEAFGLEVADKLAPDRAATRLVPEALMRERRLLPLEEDGVRIFVATAHPTDLAAEAALERMAGRMPVFRVAPPGALDEALDRFLAPAAEPADSMEAEAGGDRSRPRILVVDDDTGARLLARSVLERDGYDVLEAGDGVDALESVQEHPDVGLAVVDLKMPRMDGREFVRALRAEPWGRGLPVVVVTGAEDPGLEADLIEDGADDYIRKPLEPRLFLARVRATLRRAGGPGTA